MPITLAQAKVGMADKVEQNVIDEFRRGSLLLDALTFDDAVSPGTGGSTLTYGYTQLKTPATAGFRELNTEYTPQEADRDKKSTDLKIFGGSFQVDRVLANTSGAVDEIDFQLKEKITATINTFHNAVVNGDADTEGFDGLDLMLVGSSTEINADVSKAIDLSTAAQVDANYKSVPDMLDEFLAELDGVPTMLMGNSKLITKLKACARRAGYLTQREDAFGRTADSYNGIPLVDLQYFYNGATTLPIVPIASRKYGASGSETTVTGLTDLYAARFALDGFHAVSPKGGKIISTYLPNLNAPGAVKTGEVEMVAATVLKKTRAAGVLRNFKVQ